MWEPGRWSAIAGSSPALSSSGTLRGEFPPDVSDAHHVSPGAGPDGGTGPVAAAASMIVSGNV